MTHAIELRLARDLDPVAVSALVSLSFRQLAAADWEPQAQATFLADAAPESLAAKISDSFYSAGLMANGSMAGFISMPTPALLGMLFVHPGALRNNFGRLLWEGARSWVEAHAPTVKTVELNATPYAVSFYRSIGFMPISAEVRRAGCRFTRMACWLPARDLAQTTLAT